MLPYAVATFAFLLILSAWVRWYVAVRSVRRFLLVLESQPLAERPSVCRLQGISYDWLRRFRHPQMGGALTRKERAVATWVTVFGAGAIAVSAAFLSRRPPGDPVSEPMGGGVTPMRSSAHLVTVATRSSSKQPEAILERLDTQRARLGRLIDKERQRSYHLAVVTPLGKLEPRTEDLMVPEVARCAEALLSSIREARELSDPRVRAAESLLRTASREYEEALRVLRDAGDNLPAAECAARATALFGLRRWNEALDEYLRLTSLEPTNRTARWSTAAVFAQVGKVGNAIQILNEIACVHQDHGGTDDPDSLSDRARILHSLALMHWLDQSPEKCARIAAQGLDMATRAASCLGAGAVEREIASACVTHGVALAAQGQHVDALRSLDRAIDIWTRLASKWPGLFTESAARAMLLRADSLTAVGRNDLALKDYGAALVHWSEARSGGLPALAPVAAYAHFRRGHLFHSARAFTQAVADYEAALALEPSLADAFATTELGPNFAISLACVGFAASTSGRPDQQSQAPRSHGRAVEVCTKLLEFLKSAPSEPPSRQQTVAAWRSLRAMCNVGRGALKEGAADYDAAILALSETSPSSEIVHTTVACCVANRAVVRLLMEAGTRPCADDWFEHPSGQDLDYAVRILGIPTCAYSDRHLDPLTCSILALRTRVLGREDSRIAQIPFPDLVAALVQPACGKAPPIDKEKGK
jgi:tetratricopeptide (TPR) repeat protein